MAKKPAPTRTAAPAKIPAHPLTAMEMRIAAEFFEKCAEGYVDHSANEFDLPDTPVLRKIVTAAEKRYAKLRGNKPDKLSTRDGLIYATDYILFHYFAQRWGWLAHRLERGEATEPLAREELLTCASLLELLSRNDYGEYAKPNDDPDYSLPPTAEGRQLAEAVIRHKGVRDADKRVKAALAGEYGCDVHATWLLAYLAGRCTGIATTSLANGLAFDGDYSIPAQADRVNVPGKAGTLDAGKLPVVKRPGISSSWLRMWKRDVNLFHKGRANGLPRYYFDSLMEYVNEGFSEPGKPYNLVRLATRMAQYAYNKIELIEQDAVEHGTYDVSALVTAFSGWHFSTLMKVRYWSQLASDEPDLDLSDALMAAYGMILGCKKEASLMAKALTLAHRMQMFRYPEFYPASQCILQIFASYLGEPALMLKGGAATHPIYKPLAAHWRHPDDAALTPLLLAACDEHTYRNYSGKPEGCGADFDIFSRTPVEILLIFKLREELGLPNPKLDHPLMNTPLGQLPKEAPFAMDEVITAVMKLARAEGFDENKALADIVKAVTKAK